ncbi:TfoX/Sxy family protein [Defluviimonas sp. WL0050]|uniref:TfoX/Sxy family protein n=1 Tax=Albidovulum litorale TaxID=2984134 RepID=A0ABT2ZQT1_9RHOB|nr:TfoX/Sxy family protein [Defluviimonas sp. WL0050]MCV2873106.1 TfoX/Sxy family protein [Defluviimonas sp. WL0050]
MPTPVSTIPNLGPASEAAFARAGIHSAEEIRAMGADAAYLRLLQADTRPHFIGYYVLVMGLQGRPWNDCQGAEKAALRTRFDELKAQAARTPSNKRDRLRLEAVLDEIGLREPPK